MNNEKGTSGLIGLTHRKLAIDGWEIQHNDKTVTAYCDCENFVDMFGITAMELVKVIGSNWLVRFENEDHIYYGSAVCKAISRPALQIPDPKQEYFPRDFAMDFSFRHAQYGPYHVAEAKAMARNGNDMFFDLLSLAEVDEMIASGDMRFKTRTPYTA